FIHFLPFIQGRGQQPSHLLQLIWGTPRHSQAIGHDQNTSPMRHPTARRIRMNSESHTSSVSRDEELVVRGEDEICTPTEGDPFRRRSKSAPPALWAAKKYGQQLRRMSDEFDSLLDKGMKKAKNAGTTRKMHHSKTWWSYLFSHQESDGENSHHENHTQRTE
uniref:BCL2 associated agonist of cell death b n=1 Tax=Amphilophus citrinellus TaxID=61819 RepID=A0A3Q0QNQ2_AMPCI